MAATNPLSLYISNLAFTVSQEELLALFSPFGKVTNVKMIHWADGRPRGVAFITFASLESGEQAIKAMDQKDVKGRLINVRYAHVQNADAAALAPALPAEFDKFKTDFFAACVRADEKALDQLIKDCPWAVELLNSRNDNGVTALSLLLTTPNPEPGLRVLLADARLTGETLNCQDRSKRTALHWAGFHNVAPARLLQILLADARLKPYTLNALDSNHEPVLWYALSNGKNDVAQLLLKDRRVIVKEAGQPNLRFFHSACATCNAETARLFLSHPSLTDRDVKYLLNQYDSVKQSAFHYACMNKKCGDEVAMLVLTHPSLLAKTVSARDEYNRPALAYALADNGHMFKERTDSPFMLKLLQDPRLDPTDIRMGCPQKHRTVLHYACQYGLSETMRTVLKDKRVSGRMLTQEDKNHSTPLSSACMSNFTEGIDVILADPRSHNENFIPMVASALDGCLQMRLVAPVCTVLSSPQIDASKIMNAKRWGDLLAEAYTQQVSGQLKNADLLRSLLANPALPSNDTDIQQRVLPVLLTPLADAEKRSAENKALLSELLFVLCAGGHQDFDAAIDLIAKSPSSSSSAPTVAFLLEAWQTAKTRADEISATLKKCAPAQTISVFESQVRSFLFGASSSSSSSSPSAAVAASSSSFFSPRDLEVLSNNLKAKLAPAPAAAAASASSSSSKAAVVVPPAAAAAAASTPH